jgi:hypothetical protein
VGRGADRWPEEPKKGVPRDLKKDLIRGEALRAAQLHEVGKTIEEIKKAIDTEFGN